MEKAGVKLFAVSIGTAESAAEFASQVGLPAEMVFADEEAVLYKALNFVNSDFSEEGGQRGARMLSAATFDAIKRRANGRPWSFFGLFDIPWSATNDDLEMAKELYRPLLPQGEDAMDKSLIQGGAFAFQGSKELLGHRDSNVGVHVEMEQVLAAIAA
eukprot:CAMPEP_0179054710 /NCGR_PEP_ID=MMETSP0796-20121207/22928_1 /TAXON_ID=73915 /ORGANISM="Pyrodinium bahamense, Strain pbaha01" /LENGTH=157 /DNA_ID=CAMNT_0020751345 /DNA_START=114 /DNA_END=587 /DNA_ORIENTATION=-